MADWEIDVDWSCKSRSSSAIGVVRVRKEIQVVKVLARLSDKVETSVGADYVSL